MRALTNSSDRRLCFVALLLTISPAALSAGTGYRVAFVTSTKNVGELAAWPENSSSGLSDPLDLADHICQVRAEAGGLATAGVPVFRAWISISTVDAYCHVQGLTGLVEDIPPCGGATLTGGGPWILPDGRPVSGDLDSLVDDVSGGPLIPFAVDETGAVVPADNYMTGTRDDGIAHANNCADWATGVSGTVTGGRTDSVGSGWSHGAATSCAATLRLVCLEQGTGPIPEPPGGPGALVFATSGFDVGALVLWADAEGLPGLQGGDKVCENLAKEAGLPAPEAFVAWLSDDVTAAGDRLTIDGPWRRIDGYVVADSKSDLLDGFLDAPVLIDETGARLLSRGVWTGTTTAGAAAAARCYEWTSGLYGDLGERGRTTRTNSYWTQRSSPDDCNESLSLYCFSNVVTIFWDRFESGDTSGWSDVVP